MMIQVIDQIPKCQVYPFDWGLSMGWVGDCQGVEPLAAITYPGLAGKSDICQDFSDIVTQPLARVLHDRLFFGPKPGKSDIGAIRCQDGLQFTLLADPLCKCHFKRQDTLRVDTCSLLGDDTSDRPFTVAQIKMDSRIGGQPGFTFFSIRKEGRILDAIFFPKTKTLEEVGQC